MPEESFDLRRGSSNRKLSYRESIVLRKLCLVLGFIKLLVFLVRGAQMLFGINL